MFRDSREREIITVIKTIRFWKVSKTFWNKWFEIVRGSKWLKIVERESIECPSASGGAVKKRGSIYVIASCVNTIVRSRGGLARRLFTRRVYATRTTGETRLENASQAISRLNIRTKTSRRSVM